MEEVVEPVVEEGLKLVLRVEAPVNVSQIHKRFVKTLHFDWNDGGDKSATLGGRDGYVSLLGYNKTVHGRMLPFSITIDRDKHLGEKGLKPGSYIAGENAAGNFAAEPKRLDNSVAEQPQTGKGKAEMDDGPADADGEGSSSELEKKMDVLAKHFVTVSRNFEQLRSLFGDVVVLFRQHRGDRHGGSAAQAEVEPDTATPVSSNEERLGTPTGAPLWEYDSEYGCVGMELGVEDILFDIFESEPGGKKQKTDWAYLLCSDDLYLPGTPVWVVSRNGVTLVVATVKDTDVVTGRTVVANVVGRAGYQSKWPSPFMISNGVRFTAGPFAVPVVIQGFACVLMEEGQHLEGQGRRVPVFVSESGRGCFQSRDMNRFLGFAMHILEPNVLLCLVNLSSGIPVEIMGGELAASWIEKFLCVQFLAFMNRQAAMAGDQVELTTPSGEATSLTGAVLRRFLSACGQNEAVQAATAFELEQQRQKKKLMESMEETKIDEQKTRPVVFYGDGPNGEDVTIDDENEAIARFQAKTGLTWEQSTTMIQAITRARSRTASRREEPLHARAEEDDEDTVETLELDAKRDVNVEPSPPTRKEDSKAESNLKAARRLQDLLHDGLDIHNAIAVVNSELGMGMSFVVKLRVHLPLPDAPVLVLEAESYEYALTCAVTEIGGAEIESFGLFSATGQRIDLNNPIDENVRDVYLRHL